MKLRRVLVANRGEIAIRVFRACREAGIETVAIYSDADAGAPHVRAADHALRIGPPPARDSYLNVEAILAAARDISADAVHPGYGFLSENAGFARACETAGLVFIGPAAETIETMGSKIAARALMESAGVPVVPGATPHDQSDEGVLAAAKAIGLPALVKASAGGGGKGMRLLSDVSSAVEEIRAARREATSAFGDGTLYVERHIDRPRHIEIQVFGDAHGGVVHLFERECSVQRRHQKVIEESPSTAISAGVRQRMGEAAVQAARATRYRGAGTIEFLLEGSGDDARFYFLEMNTRLQVEHPVTEAVAGVDLVRAQLAVAAGERLPWTAGKPHSAWPCHRIPRLCRRSCGRFSAAGRDSAALPRACGAGDPRRLWRDRRLRSSSHVRSAAREADRVGGIARTSDRTCHRRAAQLSGPWHPHEHPLSDPRPRSPRIQKRPGPHRVHRSASGRIDETCPGLSRSARGRGDSNQYRAIEPGQ